MPRKMEKTKSDRNMEGNFNMHVFKFIYIFVCLFAHGSGRANAS